MPMERRFATLDVFTDRPFTGNPLAVVIEADGLDTAAMAAIAREFNHPETVFILPVADRTHRARLRIFTPSRELPFAGHPTVGTAVLLGLSDGGSTAREIVLEEPIGLVRCVVEPTIGNGGRARFTLPQMPAMVGAVDDAASVASALGLALEDLGFGKFRHHSKWTAGNVFAFVPVADLDAIARCRPDPHAIDRAFGGDSVYVFTAETAQSIHGIRARMFATRLGIAEDPATGSAAAAFAGLLAASGTLGDGEHTIAIKQGYEMGRPSQIHLTLALADGKLVSASVGGEAVVVTRGAITA
jgi:trans-2,3-dihydro-3-hydroxyanthranilate isomerase